MVIKIMYLYGCVNGNEDCTNENFTGWTAGGGFGIFSETTPTGKLR